MIRRPWAYSPRLARVIPSGHEEDVRFRLANAEGLLLHAADRRDRAVELDLPRRGDAVAAVDAMAELLHHLEREREPGRRPADVACVDLHLQRQVDVRRLRRREPDECARALERIGHGLDRHRLVLGAARDRRASTVEPGWTRPSDRAQAARSSASSCRSPRSITSVGCSFPTAWLPSATASTITPAGRRNDLVAERPERDRARRSSARPSSRADRRCAGRCRSHPAARSASPGRASRRSG